MQFLRAAFVKANVKNFLTRLLSAVFGLFLFSTGVSMTIRANIGFPPWDVFHSGLASSLGVTIGAASVLAGLLILVVVKLAGEKLGFGTVLGMTAPGVFLDIILSSGFIPQMEGAAQGAAMLLAGLVVNAIGAYFFLRAALGAGPRDYLMLALARRTGLPIGACRSVFELAATGAGWLLGGRAGLGTVMSAVTAGFCLQIVFKALKFNATAVSHETFAQTAASLAGKSKSA